uniref:restriction endonuclease subunit S n=1 Tax=Mesosutterella multiformis TaxID=2259133 RepID=UPI004027F64C
MQEKAKEPEIRFAGFTGAWEQRKAKDLFAAYSDKGHPDLDVLSATQDRGMVRRDDNNINISHDKKNEATYKRVLPGQFVIHLRSFQGGFAYSSIEGITSPAYTVFGFSKPQEHEPNFWKFVFSSEQFIKRLEKVTYGIRDGRSISYDEVLTLSFTFPGKNEQIQIAHFLDKVGALITLHQRKYEKLLNIKKSMLEKMFPKEGEVVPEIRFKGFTGAWEQRKAKDLFAAYSDKGHPDLDVLSATQDRGMVRRDDNNINISHDKKNEATYKRVLPGQFVIHLRSFQGGFAYSSIEGITSPAYTVFGFSKPQEHEPNFWKFVFSSEQFIKRLEKVTYGIRDGRSISYDEVLTLSFTFPGKNEQIQIAHFLDKVGALITLHQRKLEMLKNVKQAFLEKMFV